MLEDDYQQELIERLAQAECRIEVPRSLRRIFARRGPNQGKHDERRRFTRFAHPAKTLLEVTTTIAGIPRSHEFSLILVTDLSREGVAFLHSQQLFPGEVSWVWFGPGKLVCRIIRCRQHNPRCFEIGAIFDAGPQEQAWLRAARGESSRECVKRD